MRKGFNGLHGLVHDRLELEPRTGHLLQWPIDCTQLIGEASSSADYAPISSFFWQTLRLDRAQVPFRRKLFIFLSPSGDLRQIPAVWTDFMKTDAFVEVAAGRSTLHAGFLLELAELLKHLKEGSSDRV
jgi:Family of unknown function (DUF5372)